MVVALAVLFVTACGASVVSTELPRRMGGVRRVGTFVSPSSYEAFVRAERAMTRAELEDAVYQYRYALAGAYEDPFVLARLAIALDAVGRRDDANEALSRALQLDAQSEAAWLARGDIAARHEEHASAIAAYEQAASAEIGSIDGALKLAEALRINNSPERANAVLESLAQRGGEGGLAGARAQLAMAVARDDGESIVASARAVMRIAPMATSELRTLAERVLESGNARGALQLLSAVPDSAGDEPLRVRALLAAGRYADVEAYLATHELSRLGNTLEIAKLYLQAHRPARALELAEGALLEGPTPEAHYVAGASAYALLSNDRAALHLAAVPHGAHEYTAARTLLARILLLEGMQSEAGEVLRALAASNPDDANSPSDANNPSDADLRALREASSLPATH
ncbi:MAG: hypothetical protein IPK60_15940 [Sandaracinaceae bacterium]|nr:hypothetical protein [Sandaracinaceae bacterium]